MADSMYGDLIRLDSANGGGAKVLRRVPLEVGAAAGGVSETTLQDLLFRHPETLPIASIDPAYAGIVPVCRELATPAGYVDALYVNHLGRLTLAEFKLWRNPQARREVIGQILDYAKDLASWGYEDLQRQVSMALRKQGNVLYDLVSQRYGDVPEADFVDNVARHLRRGEFLLLIVGDGIQEGAAGIVDFVQRYSGLHFNLALVEAALYRDGADSLVVQPRVLAKTEIVQRFVVDAGTGVVVPDVESAENGQPEGLSEREQEYLRFWTAVLDGFVFSDVTVNVPSPVPAEAKYPTLSVRVVNSGQNGWGLSFNGYVRNGYMGCYLSPRRGQTQAVRVFTELDSSFDTLQAEIDGLDSWSSDTGRQRIGVWRHCDIAFLSASEDSQEFRDAVLWMRENLDRLVSELHPRLQRMLAGGR